MPVRWPLGKERTTKGLKRTGSKLGLVLEDKKAAIQKHWDANVCDYNKGTNFAEIDANRPRTYPYLKRELDISGDRGKAVLEIGVGSASDACFSLTEGNPARYVLFDLSPNTLKVAKQHLDEHCSGKPYEFVNGDASNMDMFKDGEFDRVKAMGSIHHIPTYRDVFREISRVLKPNGDLLFMVYDKNSRRYKHTYPRAVKRRGEKTLEQYILEVDGPTNPYTYMFTKSELKQICLENGLKCNYFRKYELTDDDRSVIIKGHYCVVYPRFLERGWGFSLYVQATR